MPIEIVLEPCATHTHYAPLAALGYYWTRTGLLAPLWNSIDWPMKAVSHQPYEKMQDLLVAILAGARRVYEINTRIRPDRALALAWQRPQFAEQSSVSLLLDSLTPAHITQFRQALNRLLCQHGQTVGHDFAQHWLLIDVDTTGLLASRQAEGSRQGYISGEINRFGRQLARVTSVSYHENLYSKLYPGNQQAATVLKVALQDVESLCHWTPADCAHIIVRMDAGLGTDGNVNWLLHRSYQVLTKGFSGSRAVKLARQVPAADWQEDVERKRAIAWAPQPKRYGRRIHVFVLRWQAKDKERFGTLLSSLLQLDPLATLRLYDGRGADEVEIRADKQGLSLPHRRKKSFCAQEALALLTDLAHNLLSWLHHAVLENGPFAAFGTLRMVRDLLCIPGRLEYMDGRLHKVALLDTHPYAPGMCRALGAILAQSEIP